MNKIEYFQRRGMLVHLGWSEEKIDNAMVRTSGECICEECGKEHRKHPYIDDVLYLGDPYLHYLCDGRLAKL